MKTSEKYLIYSEVIPFLFNFVKMKSELASVVFRNRWGNLGCSNSNRKGTVRLRRVVEFKIVKIRGTREKKNNFFLFLSIVWQREFQPQIFRTQIPRVLATNSVLFGHKFGRLQTQIIAWLNFLTSCEAFSDLLYTKPYLEENGKHNLTLPNLM
jgi:hypothetical protein